MSWGGDGVGGHTMTDSSEPVVAQIQHPEATQILQSFNGCDVVVREVQKVQRAWERTGSDSDCIHRGGRKAESVGAWKTIP